MIKKYNELSESLKEDARKICPDDYEEWGYHIKGLEIAWAFKKQIKSNFNDKLIDINGGFIMLNEKEMERELLLFETELVKKGYTDREIRIATCSFKIGWVKGEFNEKANNLMKNII